MGQRFAGSRGRTLSSIEPGELDAFGKVAIASHDGRMRQAELFGVRQGGLGVS